MEKFVIEILKEKNIGTFLVAIITYFIMQMSNDLQKIQVQISSITHQNLMYQQRTDMRLNTIDKIIKSISQDNR